MSDAEIEALMAEIDRMARRVGGRFRPDPNKLAAFRAAQRKQEE
jgi:hypothetical protein